MTTDSSGLATVVRELAEIGQCRAYNGIATGGVLRECRSAPRIVTLACEHEHFYEVSLCEQHIGRVPTDLLHCPHCFIGAGADHVCRHAVLRETTS